MVSKIHRGAHVVLLAVAAVVFEKGLLLDNDLNCHIYKIICRNGLYQLGIVGLTDLNDLGDQSPCLAERRLCHHGFLLLTSLGLQRLFCLELRLKFHSHLVVCLGFLGRHLLIHPKVGIFVIIQNHEVLVLFIFVMAA